MLLVSILLISYAFLLVFSSIIWFIIPNKFQNGERALNRPVSIVIAFRNEESNLNELLASLNSLKYPKDKLEIIFVNDHSTDSSKSLLNQLLESFSFKHLILELPDHLNGKKQAQLFGVNQAINNIIMTTDADCVVPVNWVNNCQEYFANKKLHFITSNVTFRGHGFWNSLMRTELAPLIGITGVSIYFKNAMLANGANMAFLKSSYLDVLNSRTDINNSPSGDDTFLLEAIKKRFGRDAIAFGKGNLVITNAPKTLKSFYNQRIRWAAKWKLSSSIGTTSLAIALWLFHFIFIVFLIYSMVANNLNYILLLLIPKILGELLLISVIHREYPFRFNMLSFLIATIFYSLYVILFGLTANFVKYKWKDRAYG